MKQEWSLLILCFATAFALDNGLARTPPMGWRSWNLFGHAVSQELMMQIMDGFAARRLLVDGKPTSLCELGYCNIGLDDNWQKCGGGKKGYNYHDQSGSPVINAEKFPSMKAMTAHAHALGLRADWYGNNCICSEGQRATRKMYEEDVNALHKFQFDGIKLDKCGSMQDLNLWAKLLNKTGRPVMLENCHWGYTIPKKSWCPWNFFRTSGDVRANYGSIVSCLLSTVQFARNGLSRPGCWAYPDMLQVGCKNGPGGSVDKGLNDAETRSHFGSWCIVSAPLILSLDVRDDSVLKRYWPVIANPEAIAVNQAWAGHSGSPFKQSNVTLKVKGYADQTKTKFLGDFGVPAGQETPLPSWHYFYKPIGQQKVAVLIMNHAPKPQSLILKFADIPGLLCTRCHVRDVWSRTDLGFHQGEYHVKALDSHDSAFLVVSPETGSSSGQTTAKPPPPQHQTSTLVPLTSCPSKVSVNGLNAIPSKAASCTGTFTLAGHFEQKPNYISENGRFLLYSSSLGRWLVSTQQTDKHACLMSRANSTALCPTESKGWKAHDGIKWSTAYRITISVVERGHEKYMAREDSPASAQFSTTKFPPSPVPADAFSDSSPLIYVGLVATVILVLAALRLLAYCGNKRTRRAHCK